MGIYFPIARHLVIPIAAREVVEQQLCLTAGAAVSISRGMTSWMVHRYFAALMCFVNQTIPPHSAPLPLAAVNLLPGSLILMGSLSPYRDLQRTLGGARLALIKGVGRVILTPRRDGSTTTRAGARGKGEMVWDNSL